MPILATQSSIVKDDTTPNKFIMSGIAIFSRLNSRERRRRPSYVNNLVSRADSNIIKSGDLVYEYLEDCNISQIHSRVLHEIRARKSGILELQTEKSVLESKLESVHTLIDYKFINKQIVDLQRKIDDLNADNIEERYLESVTPLLREYRRYNRVPKVVSFNKQTVIDNNSPKCIVIAKIVSLAEEFVDVKILKPPIFSEKCHICNHELSEPDMITGTKTCDNCGYVYNIIIRSGDSIKIDGADFICDSGDSGYEDRENFEKAIDRFQGKQPDTLPSDLNDSLDGYFMSIDLPTGKYIRENRKLNSSGRRVGTSRKMIHNALKSLQLTSYYPDINLIGKNYWGWKLIDLSRYKERLMSDYDKSQAIYVSIPKERKSSLNTDYRLMKHLQLLNVPCNHDDFKNIKTRKILIEYERIWRIICDRCGWRFIPCI